jgi:hypothetical protein
MQIIRLTLICTMAVVLAGCPMGGVQHVSVVDEDRKELKDIIVLPLYQSSYGIGIGPDGHGLWSSSKLFTKPFPFSSGEDLMSKQIQGRGITALLVFIGTSKYVNTWLFIKKGYAPTVIDRYAMYGGSAIVVSTSKGEGAKRCIDLLLSKEPDQTELKKMFQDKSIDGDIKLELDSQSTALLSSNK